MKRLLLLACTGLLAGSARADAQVTVRGELSGSATAPVLNVAGTKDRYALAPFASTSDLSAMLGKTVIVEGVIPQVSEGKVSDTLRYKEITQTNKEAK